MKVAIWDTYVTKKDGSIMHFDIIVPETLTDVNKIHDFGKTYLKSKNQDGQPSTTNECVFCHIESIRPQWEIDIKSKGYSIYEMENC